MRSRKLISGSILNTLNLLAQIASGFYVMPLLINTFGDAKFGIWILVSSFMGYAAIFDLGLPSAVSRFVSQAIGKGGGGDRKEISCITATSFYIFLGITFLTIALIALVIGFASVFVRNEEYVGLFQQLLFVLCLNNLVVFPTAIFEGVLTANLRHDLVNSRKIIFTVLRLVLTIVIVKTNGSLVDLAWMTAGTNIMENLIRVSQCYRFDPQVSVSPINFKMSMVRQLFGYSVYSFIGKIADTLRFQINALVISAAGDVAQITPYRIASRLIEYFIQFIGGMTGVLSPYFSQEEGRKNFEGIKEKFLLITKLVTYIVFFLGGILVLYGENLISLWIGAKYPNSYIVLIILVVPVTVSLSQSVIFPLLYGISKHKFLAYLNMAEGVLNLVLSILLVKPLGIIGVALGTAIPLLITKVFIQPVYVTRILGISLGRYIWGILGPMTLTILSLGLPWLFLSPYMKPILVNMFCVVVVHLVFFLIIVVRFGFTPEEIQFFLRIFKRKS